MKGEIKSEQALTTASYISTFPTFSSFPLALNVSMEEVVSIFTIHDQVVIFNTNIATLLTKS